jgi:murein DD-endopeptidase MepM/ murein hydrolase activator NlpD
LEFQFHLLEFLEAISCYPFQSFAPNPGTKGFPLLSGLGTLFYKEGLSKLKFVRKLFYFQKNIIFINYKILFTNKYDMSKLKIFGKANPLVGKKEYYSIHDFFASSNPASFDPSQFQNLSDEHVKWSIWTFNGSSWSKRSENNKTGITVPYTFSQKSLNRKGIRMLVEANGEKAVLDIKTEKATQGKIVHVDLLDNNYNKPTRPFAYGDWIIARVHCVDMELLPVKVTLWEDDGDKTKHNTTNVRIETKISDILNGIAYAKFYLNPSHAWLANAKLAKGDKNEGEFHEYYVTAEIFEKISKRVPSKNANVPNPDFKPEAQAPNKQTPAQKKGPSKKEEKGIAKSDKNVHDYHEQKVSVQNKVVFNPMDPINSLMTVNVDPNWWKKKGEKKEKLIIFPLLVKPENDKENKWGKDRNWTAKQGANMTTFNSNRDHGKRKHAGRDLYTNSLETVVAIADGVVLDIKPFYCETNQVTIRHTLKDGRDFIIRYGELDPNSVLVKIGEKITQKQKLGETGKLLKYLSTEKKHIPLMQINDVIVFMLHFEHFSGSLKFDLNNFPLSNSSKPYNRRADLIDSLAILQEGYNNSFGVKPTINKDESREFTEHDARLALMKIYDLYGKEMAQTIESIYRWEGKHFKSDQYKICGSPGMEVPGNKSAPNYGWDGSLYAKHPEYTPIGVWKSFENIGMSGAGGNEQDTKNKKTYIKFPSVEAGMMYIVDFINRHDGNVGRWHSTDPKIQKNYVTSIKTAIPRIVNQF